MTRGHDQSPSQDQSTAAPAVMELAPAGSGPPIVLIHGFAGSNDIWPDEFVERLSVTHRCTAVGLPWHHTSHAQSHVDEQSFSADAAISSVARAIARNCRGRAIIVGHSTGGWLALRVAAQRPDLVLGVVSISGFASGKLAGLLGLVQLLASHGKVLRRAASFALRLSVRRPALLAITYRHLTGGRPGACVEQLLVATLPAMRRIDPRNLILWLRLLRGQSATAWVAEIGVPVLLLHGENDPAVKASGPRHIASQLSGSSTLVMLPGIGHFPFVEATADVADRIDDWIAQCFPVSPS